MITWERDDCATILMNTIILIRLNYVEFISFKILFVHEQNVHLFFFLFFSFFFLRRLRTSAILLPDFFLFPSFVLLLLREKINKKRQQTNKFPSMGTFKRTRSMHEPRKKYIKINEYGNANKYFPIFLMRELFNERTERIR